VSSRPLLIALLVAGACGSGNRPGSSSGQPQVVYLGVDGAKDPKIDERVEELIRKRFDIIDRDTYMEKARELDAEKVTRKNLAKVTSSLGAVALVHGGVKGKKVTIFVRDAKKGKIKERYKLSLKKGKLAKKSDRALEKGLLASVKTPKKKEPPPPPPPKEEEPKEEDEAVAAEEDKEDPPPKIETDETGQAIDDEMPPM
jgi:hypothetical protein